MGARTSTRAGHFSIPSLPVCFSCLHLAAQGTLTREKLSRGLIQVNPGHYGWMTPMNSDLTAADALSEILHLTEHSSSSNPPLAWRTAGLQQLCCWKGTWECFVTERDSRNSGPYCECCNNLVYSLYLKCVPFCIFPVWDTQEVIEFLLWVTWWFPRNTLEQPLEISSTAKPMKAPQSHYYITQETIQQDWNYFIRQ